MSFREEIPGKLKETRPNLSASSLKTYVSILYNLKKKLDGEEDDQILDFLKDKEPQTRKTSLSALFVLTGKSSYNDLMLTDCKHTNEIYKQQKKTQKQEEGWMTIKEIQTVYDELQLGNLINQIDSPDRSKSTHPQSPIPANEPIPDSHSSA